MQLSADSRAQNRSGTRTNFKNLLPQNAASWFHSMQKENIYKKIKSFLSFLLYLNDPLSLDNFTLSTLASLFKLVSDLTIRSSDFIEAVFRSAFAPREVCTLTVTSSGTWALLPWFEVNNHLKSNTIKVKLFELLFWLEIQYIITWINVSTYLERLSKDSSNLYDWLLIF